MTAPHDQVAVITGATSGVGRALARDLAQRGVCLILLGRDPDRARRLLDSLRRLPGARVDFLPCEFSDLRQIRATAAAIRALAPAIHVLVNNAHVRPAAPHHTADGIELTFAVNHLAHFTLTALLLESLLAAPQARILNVAGDAYQWGDPEWKRAAAPEAFSTQRALATSKLANVVFTVELARRLRGTSVTVNAAHPGIVATRAGTGGDLWRLLKYFVSYGIRGQLISARRAARPLAELCVGSEYRESTGRYFSGGQVQEVSAQARNPDVAARLWELSLRLTRLGADLGPAWRYFAE